MRVWNHNAVFPGNSETSAVLRSLDWTKTPLGAVDTWPQSLRTSISICLNSAFAILVWWGSELAMLYNDAYIPLISSKHPRALGAPGHQVFPEIWDTIGPMLDSVLSRGEAVRADDLLLVLDRNDYPEECYFTFSYSPILDETGGFWRLPTMSSSGLLQLSRKRCDSIGSLQSRLRFLLILLLTAHSRFTKPESFKRRLP